jgi:hypothetical protein
MTIYLQKYMWGLKIYHIPVYNLVQLLVLA